MESIRRIVVLPPDVANTIAAGEVVDRPSSVVKELLENAIDAGSTQIEVEIRDAGHSLIRVSDDGHGILKDDVPVAFHRHATSKLKDADGLSAIRTLGFRGEALPSITAVSRVQLRTRTSADAEGSLLEIHGGTILRHEPVGAPPGTSITVSDLFYNTPARKKFLKAASTERRHIVDVVGHLAMAHPSVRFRLICEGREVLVTPGKGDALGALVGVWGRQLAAALVPVNGELGGIRVTGFAGKPETARTQRSAHAFFVNGRWIQHGTIRAALERSYQGLLPSRHYPVAALFVAIDPAAIDVNVHPNKTEVRFRDDRMLFRTVSYAVQGALRGVNLAPTWDVQPAQTNAGGAGRPQPGGRHRDAERESQDDQLADLFWKSKPVPAVASPLAAATDVAASVVAEQPNAYQWSRSDQGTKPDVERLRPPQNVAEVLQELVEGTILGQLAQTYILVSTRSGVVVIDQHVAHERLLHEQLMDRLQGENALSWGGQAQGMLIPVPVEVDAARCEALEAERTLLAKVGFEFDRFGPHTVLVRQVPLPLRGREVTGDWVATFVQELADMLSTVPAASAATAHAPEGAAAAGLPDLPLFVDRILSSISCRSAVMAGDPLQQPEMERLVRQLVGLRNPFRCPHGRPILVHLTFADIERRFDRR